MNWAPWSILVAFMLLVWIVMYLREGSSSRATIDALVAGKAAAVVYKIRLEDAAEAPHQALWHRAEAPCLPRGETKNALISLLPEQLYESLEAAAKLGIRPPSYARLRA